MYAFRVCCDFFFSPLICFVFARCEDVSDFEPNPMRRYLTTLVTAYALVCAHHCLCALSASPTTVCPVNISAAEIAASGGSLSQQEMYSLLDCHNNARTQIRYAASMPLLEWSGALASQAADWVEKCDVNISWSSASVGFNLGMGNENVSDVARSWSDQYLNYQFTGGSCTTSSTSPSVCGSCMGGNNFDQCNNYLQMIWSTTSSVGCAKAECTGGTGAVSTWVVCAYSPRGLIANQGPYVGSTTSLSGCQYPVVAAPGDGGPSTWKVLGGIGAGLLMLVGGGAYMYLDGGDGCCCDGQQKRDRGRVYDAEAMNQLNSTQSPMVVDAVPMGSEHAV